jgi:hypothetical protein
MALQKQTVTFPMGLGIQTKTDEKLVEAGSFNLVCENATFDKVGAVKKRTGFLAESADSFTIGQNAGTAAADIYAQSIKPSSYLAGSVGSLLKNPDGTYYKKQSEKWVRYGDKFPEVHVSRETVFANQNFVANTSLVYNPDENILAATGLYVASLSAGSATTDGSVLVLKNLDDDSVITCEAIPGQTSATPIDQSVAGYSLLNGEYYYYNAMLRNDGTLIIYIYNKYGQRYSTTLSVANFATPANNCLASCISTDKSNFYIIGATTTSGTARIISVSGTVIDVNATFSHGLTTLWKFSDAVFTGGKITVAYCNTTINRKVILNSNGTVDTPAASFTADVVENLGIDRDDNTTIHYTTTSFLVKATGYTNTIQNISILGTKKISLGDIPMSLLLYFTNESSVSLDDICPYMVTVEDSTIQAGRKPVANIDDLRNSLPVKGLWDIVKVSPTLAYMALPRTILESGTGQNG